MSKKPPNEEALTHVSQVVRALITSAKPPVDLNSIIKDYKNVEGVGLPFRSLGYESAEDLLRDTNQFIFSKMGNETIVSAKYNPKTEHIANLVKGQKRSKSKCFSKPTTRIVYNTAIARAPLFGYQQQYQHHQQHQHHQQQYQHQHQHHGYTPSYQYHNQSQPLSARIHSQPFAGRPHSQPLVSRSHPHPQVVRPQPQPVLERPVSKPLLERPQTKPLLERPQPKPLLERPQPQEEPTEVQPSKADNPPLSAEVEQVQQELQRLLETQLEQQRIQQRYEEERQRQEREVQLLQATLLQNQDSALKRFDEELHVKLEKDIREKLERKLKAQFEQQLQEFKEQQERSLKEQAAVVEQLQKERLEQEQQKKLEQERELKKLEQERELKKQEEALQDQQKKQEQENQLWRRLSFPDTQREIMRSTKRDQEKILVTIPNGNSAKGQAESNGEISKPPLRPILGNSAPQRQQQPTDAYGYKQQRPNPRGSQTVRFSVNDRLKQKPPPDSPLAKAMFTPLTPPITPETAKMNRSANPTTKVEQPSQLHKKNMPRKSKPQPAYIFDTTLDAVSCLLRYCEDNQLEKPIYNVFNACPRLHCSVRIEGDVYSSYPEEFATAERAYERTAQVAIERIKQAALTKELAACTLSDDEFIDELYQELLKFPHGILGNKMVDWYRSCFQRHLPGHWYDLVVESDKIRIEHCIGPGYIVFANEVGSPEAISQPNNMPELQLPWPTNENATNDWNMYICHCDSTMQVWARLIDEIANFEELSMHMGRFMAAANSRRPVTDPEVLQIYLVEIRDGWNRVRVISVDKEQGSCCCRFIDFGDMAQFDFDELFHCAPQFLVLPAQAICLSMYALDKFEDHPHAQVVLVSELDGQTVVARVLTTQKQFREMGGVAEGVMEKNKCRSCLVATLYDTSTAEDIHLNDLVASRIAKSTPPPSFNDENTLVKSSPVLVANILDNGDLMVLLRNDDLKFVERSITSTVAELGEKDRVRYSDLQHDRLVFVCDESVEGSKQWYRARLVAKPTNPEEETFDVYYVDDGRQRKTHISNIYRLEANNRALATYPPQAMCVRLHDVPEMTGHMLMRLRGLMPPRCEALLKVVVKDGSKPLVNLFVRGQDPESMYMCVNIGLRLEFEMQSSPRSENCEDPHLSPLVQPRRSSLSSVVSSQSGSSDLLTPPVTPQTALARGAGHFLVPGPLKDYEAIPAVGAYFEVRVVLSVNPGHFAVQPYKYYNQLQNLMKDLQAHCQGSLAQSVQPSQLATGEAFAAPDIEGVYHRVSIRKIFDEIIYVRFVDVGDDGVVSCDQLKVLPQELKKLPKMALLAQLYGIQLTDVMWSQEQCLRFRKLTLGQKFIGIVRGSHKLKDETRALRLELVDTSTPEDIKLHEILINEKIAQPETKEV
ncbi:hypothetical protein KR018_002721 [Drosophila ironensis]|nr:hypothetical protein KR018_002721 [Drosophila ironensis]